MLMELLYQVCSILLKILHIIVRLDTESKVYVYLHADNGTISNDAANKFDTDIYKVAVSPNSNYTLPVASKTGYTFNGWKYNVGDANVISDDKDANTFGIQILIGNN